MLLALALLLAATAQDEVIELPYDEAPPSALDDEITTTDAEDAEDAAALFAEIDLNALLDAGDAPGVMRWARLMQGQNWVRPVIGLGSFAGDPRPHPLMLGIAGGRRFYNLGRIGGLFELRGRFEGGGGRRGGGYEARVDALASARLGAVAFTGGPILSASRWRSGDDVLRATPAAGAIGFITADARVVSAYVGFSPRWFVAGDRPSALASEAVLPGFGDEWAWHAGVAARIKLLRIGLESQLLHTALGALRRDAITFKIDLTGL